MQAAALAGLPAPGTGMEDPRPNFKERVEDVKYYGNWWIGCSCCSCCCFPCQCMCPCITATAHKLYTLEEPITEEVCCAGCSSGSRKDNIKSWLNGTWYCSICFAVAMGFLVVAALLTMFEPMACKIDGRSKCIECFKEDGQTDLIVDKYGDKWYEPTDVKSCLIGIGPHNVTNKKDIPYGDEVIFCVGNETKLALEGPNTAEGSHIYECPFTGMIERDSEKAETGEGDVEGGQGKYDGPNIIEWYRNPALAAASSTTSEELSDWEGFYDNVTDTWPKYADHMFTLCADDQGMEDKNGKNCQGMCDCLSGEYLINPFSFLRGVFLIISAISALVCWGPCMCFLHNKTNIAYIEMEKAEEEVEKYEEFLKQQQQGAAGMVGAALGAIAGIMGQQQDSQKQSVNQQQPPMPPPQTQPVYQQQPQPVYQQQPQPVYQQQPAPVYQQQPAPVYQQQPQPVYQQQPQPVYQTQQP